MDPGGLVVKGAVSRLPMPEVHIFKSKPPGFQFEKSHLGGGGVEQSPIHFASLRMENGSP